MTVLDVAQLAACRQTIAKPLSEVTYNKREINTALQAVEDVLDILTFDASSYIDEVTTEDVRAKTVAADLAAHRVPPVLVIIVEDWLKSNPVSVTNRSVDVVRIRTFMTDNRRVFETSAVTMPSYLRLEIVQLIIRRRIEAVL